MYQVYSTRQIQVKLFLIVGEVFINGSYYFVLILHRLYNMPLEVFSVRINVSQLCVSILLLNSSIDFFLPHTEHGC